MTTTTREHSAHTPTRRAPVHAATIADLFREGARARPDAAALRFNDGAAWHTISWRAYERAVADEPELAAVAGLDTEKVIRATWIIGASLAAVAGVFAGMDTDVHPNLGWNLLLPMFAAAILGGIGKPMGAIAGGFIIGLAEELSTFNWIGDDALVSPSYKTAVGFVIMVALLIFRPQGLFRGRLL